jgi:hypothetical protein
VHRRVERENHPEDDQAGNDDDRRRHTRTQRQGDAGRQRGENEGEDGRGAPIGFVLLIDPATQQPRSRRLDDAVADHPDCEETTRLPKGPIQYAAKEHRQADDEPDVAGTKEEDARCGQLVD